MGAGIRAVVPDLGDTAAEKEKAAEAAADSSARSALNVAVAVHSSKPDPVGPAGGRAPATPRSFPSSDPPPSPPPPPPSLSTSPPPSPSRALGCGRARGGGTQGEGGGAVPRGGGARGRSGVGEGGTARAGPESEAGARGGRAQGSKAEEHEKEGRECGAKGAVGAKVRDGVRAVRGEERRDRAGGEKKKLREVGVTTGVPRPRRGTSQNTNARLPCLPLRFPFPSWSINRNKSLSLVLAYWNGEIKQQVASEREGIPFS